MTVKITDRDKGLKALFGKLEKAAGKARTLEVGIIAEEGAKPHKGKTVQEIAAANEFGLGVPERSFIRSWYDSEEAQNMALLSKLGEQVVAGKITAEVALERAGMRFAARVQERMPGIPPPNAPATIARKGSSTTLVDKGILRASISYAVRGGDTQKKGKGGSGGAPKGSGEKKPKKAKPSRALKAVRKAIARGGKRAAKVGRIILKQTKKTSAHVYRAGRKATKERKAKRVSKRVSKALKKRKKR